MRIISLLSCQLLGWLPLPIMKIDGWSLLVLPGVVQGLFLGIFFLYSKNHRTGNRPYLGLLLLTHSLTMGEVLLCYTNLYQVYPWVVNSTEWLNFVIPPLLFLYARSITLPQLARSGTDIIHFIPGFLYLIFLIPYFSQSDAWLINSVKLAYGLPVATAPRRNILWVDLYDVWYRYFDVVVSGYLAIYLLAAARYLRVYFRQRADQSIWPSTPSRASWLVIILAYYVFIVLLFSSISALFPGDTGEIYVATCESMIYYGLSFYFIQNESAIRLEKVSRAKYVKSHLDCDTLSNLAVQAENLMLGQKLYSNSNLTILDVATLLRVPVHHLSQALNITLRLTFYEWVNQYRLAEMKRLLTETTLQHLTVDEIAYQAGFNSKSVYFPIFKKNTGQTPLQFRQKGLPGVRAGGDELRAGRR